MPNSKIETKIWKDLNVLCDYNAQISLVKEWKDLILESKYDIIVRRLSYEMMKYIKTGEEKIPYMTDIVIKNKIKFDPDDEFDDPSDRDIVEVTLEVLRDPDWKVPFTLNGGASGDEIELNLTINPESEPRSWSSINIDLHDTLRHEIEHITQVRYPTKNIKVDLSKKPIPYVDYLLLPHEVPAFVHGLNARRKKMKTSLTKAMDDFLSKHRSMFTREKEDQEIEKVKKVWSLWAKENLPNTPM